MSVTRSFDSPGDAEAFARSVGAALGMPWSGTFVGGGKHAPGPTEKLVDPVGADVTLDDATAARVESIGPRMTDKDPQWFGAVGDGAHDDTVGIQQAIDAAVGGSVLLQPGRYKITAPLVLSTNVRVRGSADFATIIGRSDGVGDVFTIHGQGGQTRVVLESLYVYGGANGIHLADGFLDRQSSFRDLYFLGQRNACIEVVGAMIGCTHWNLQMEATGVDYGLHADGSDLLGSTTWIGLRASGTTKAGVFIKQTSDGSLQPNITFINPVFELNKGPAMMLNSCEVQLVNPHFEQSGAAAPDASEFPEGCPDISMDSNYPDAVGTALCNVTLHGGAFSTPGAFQDGSGPYAGTACRVWSKNYGVQFMASRAFFRNNDRLDCAGHGDKLQALLQFCTGSVSVVGHRGNISPHEISNVSFFAGYTDDSRLGFHNKRATPAVQQSATDLPGVIAALKAYGLLAP